MKNENKLVEKVLPPLPLGSIRPGGWLLHQLRIQAEGLTGHLDEFWSDVAESGWIGGTAEGWERGPYWLDGLVPLAFLLDDEKLKTKVHRWMNYILSHQREDGWPGPIHEGGSLAGNDSYSPEQSRVVKDKSLTINRKASTKVTRETIKSIETTTGSLLQVRVLLLYR